MEGRGGEGRVGEIVNGWIGVDEVCIDRGVCIYIFKCVSCQSEVQQFSSGLEILAI